MKAAVFIDKDGTLIYDVPYNVDPDLIVLQDNCIEGLKMLCDSGYKLIVVSNQSGVACGYFSEEDLFAVEEKLRSLLKPFGIDLAGFYFCPHYARGIIHEYAVDCYCRKPMPGMLLHAAEVHHIDLANSWMIGDILNDVEAGNRAGCKTILIDNGNETERLPGKFRVPSMTCHTINEAADCILNHQYA
ncbi:MAG: HAD family hydrolase [Bacteroidetes bacterium]|nr:HAD family hydrolase [Bacteroidota bacterium]